MKGKIAALFAFTLVAAAFAGTARASLGQRDRQDGQVADSVNAVSRLEADDRMADLLRIGLMKRFPGAKIEVTETFRIIRGEQLEKVDEVSILGDDAKGEVRFLIRGRGPEGQKRVAEGAVSFAAWLAVPIALRRVLPGERLSREMFGVQDVNVASGQAREYRGVILAKDTDFSLLEARQTILEGQYPLATAVRRVPDIRKGDSVKVQLISKELTLSTLGIAQEAGYFNDQIRILTLKTKRELVGKLVSAGMVEVNL